MDATLPLVFAGGFPRSLYDLSEAQLERFLVYVWTFTNTAKHARVLPNLSNRFDRAQSLRQLISALYERLGMSYLLYFSEGLAKTKGTNIYYEIDPKKKDIIVWNKKSRSIIARIPASNVCYDAFPSNLENSRKKARIRSTFKKKNTEQNLLYPDKNKVVPIIHIELPDSDSEDPLGHGKNKVAEENSIVISDSEESVKNSPVKPRRKPSLPRRSILEAHKEDNRVPLSTYNLNNSVTISYVTSLQKTLPTIGDDEIVISDTEDSTAQEPSISKGSDRLVEEIVISDSEDAVDIENKCNFLYRLGLCEPTNLPDDPIILPVPGKGDFNKFHRLPLTTVPLLVKHSLINKSCMVPGPPGQNSSFVSTNKRFVNDNINRAKRVTGRNGRFKTVDTNNCIDYKFPKKHYRGVLATPLPFKKILRKRPPSKQISQSKKKSNQGENHAYRNSNPVVKVEKLDVHIYLKYLQKM